EFWTYAPAEHLTLAINDQFQPAADYLGSATVDTNPPHVSYALNPKMSFSDVGLVADHAYWLGGLALRDSSGPAPLGLIDVRSEGFGVGDAAASATQAGAGTLTGGTLGALAYTRQYQAWGSPPAAREGAEVFISSRDAGALAGLAGQIGAAGHQAADLTKRADVEALVSSAAGALAGLDILVVNSGGPPAGSLEEVGDDAWEDAFKLT